MALCKSPYITKGRDAVPCNHCRGCLTNRKQEWTHRIILESLNHEQNSFVTLTYSPEHMPINDFGIPTLKKEDLQLFFKRLRPKIPHKIRYYAVGEYGTSGERGINPHYHVCLFGVDERYTQEIHTSWRTSETRGKIGQQLGLTHVGTLTPQSAAYVAGYVQKKTKYNKDMYDELDILPEYATQSGGLGRNAVSLIAETLRKNPEGLSITGDVPYSLDHSGRKLPLGNYMREKLRHELDLDRTEEYWMDPFTGEIKTKYKWHGKELQKAIKAQELQDLQQNKENDPKLPEDAKASIKHAIAYRDTQSYKNFEAKQKLITENKTL